MRTDSLYSIDSLLYEIYNDLELERLQVKEAIETKKVIDGILSLYTQKSSPIKYKPIESPKKDWWPVSFGKTKSVFRVKAFSDFSGKNGYLSFKNGKEFYVLNSNKKEKTYIVTTDYKLPFSELSVSGKVPSYYFNKI